VAEGLLHGHGEAAVRGRTNRQDAIYIGRPKAVSSGG
jgi:hypothetical protein